ncbi:MAG: class I SAM-dependent methyltransferase [Actinomycetaceae bacterium]|nr:class I SAM-dependent methyltransferase [Actinomycetaceae bacterium]
MPPLSQSDAPDTQDIPQIITDQQLAEQQEYYVRRADEYDDWWHCRGVFDRGEKFNTVWFTEASEALEALNGIDLGTDVLELAPGTGTWTIHLAPRAPRLTLVDGSTEMLAHNPVTSRDGVSVEIADIFTWDTDKRFDSVIFTFWISHVPRERLTTFFASVARWLRPGGRIFFVDDRMISKEEPHTVSSSGQTIVRRLYDGTSATIVKNFFTPSELIDAAKVAGIDLEVRETPTFFQYATGTRQA